MRDRVLLGVVGKPHGVRGLLRVHSHAEDPAALAAYALHDAEGRSWRLRWRGEGVAELIDAAGAPVRDRAAAERLVNTELHADRAALPPPGEEEFYHADLLDLTARDAAGAEIGPVRRIHDYGGGVFLEIAADPPLLLPFTRACVPEIDLEEGWLRAIPPDVRMAPPDEEA